MSHPSRYRPDMREKMLSILALTIISLIANVLLTFVIAWPFALLWNASLAPVFKAPSLSYWEAFAALLTVALFKMAWTGLELSVKFRDQS